jgi:hypothetical protein
MDNTLYEDYLRFKDNPENIFPAINHENKEKIKQILIELNLNDNFDVCEYAVKAIENGINVFYINIFLGDIISDLKLNKESLLRYYRIINHSLQGDFVNHTQYDQIQHITTKQPFFAEEFLEYLMLFDEIFVFQYVVEIILYLDKFNIAEKHSRLLEMANSNIEQQIICGINGLGRIDYFDNFDLLSKTLLCLDSLLRNEHHIINGAITNSLRLLYRLGNMITSRLKDLSERNDPFILNEITVFLYSEYKNINKESFFETLLYSLVKIDSKYLGRNNNIDLLLHSMISEKENLNLVIDFLIKWMTNSDCKPDKIESLQLLDCTFSGIFSNASILQRTLLLLINNDNIFAPRLASYIISSNTHSMYQDIYFDTNSLSEIGDADIVFMCRKILGYFIHSQTILSLFYSLLIRKKNNKKIVLFLTNCFIEYIGYNYPITTIKYFEKILCDKELDATLKPICNNILENIKSILKERTEKQKLRELVPSRKDIYLLYREEWQKEQKIDELAEKKSILNIISSRSYIKYGKATSYHINGNITDPQPLKCISFSMELPYDLYVDPIKFEEDGYNFRLAQRYE